MDWQHIDISAVYNSLQAALRAAAMLRASGIAAERISIVSRKEVRVSNHEVETESALHELALQNNTAIYASGPLLEALSTIGNLNSHSLAEILKRGGFPEYEADIYSAAVGDNGVMLCAHAEGKELAKSAKNIFVQTGANHVSVKNNADEHRERELPAAFLL